jgi:hypothetical protein
VDPLSFISKTEIKTNSNPSTIAVGPTLVVDQITVRLHGFVGCNIVVNVVGWYVVVVFPSEVGGISSDVWAEAPFYATSNQTQATRS